MALDRKQRAVGVTITASPTPQLTRYLSGFNVRETAATTAVAKIRDRLAPATAITTAADGAAGNSTTGLHMFTVTWVTADGESNIGAIKEFTTAGSKIISLSGIPTYSHGSAGGALVGRRIYETKAGAPATGVTPTRAQWFLIVADSSTTIAAGMNALYLPQASITVASTTGFGATGNILVATRDGPQVVTYTSVDATHFLGCTGGTGVLATGDTVTQPLLGDNTTTTYSANVVDGSLTATNPPVLDTAGLPVVEVSLSANESAGDSFTNPIAAENDGGFYVEMTSGTADWILRGA